MKDDDVPYPKDEISNVT